MHIPKTAVRGAPMKSSGSEVTGFLCSGSARHEYHIIEIM